MEITAAIEGLLVLSSPSVVTLYSDSQYLVYTMTRGWKRRVNVDLWADLDALLKVHKVTFKWVRGHSGLELNELADELAAKALVKHGGEPHWSQRRSDRAA
jgi:ribonuclease HI